MMRMMMTGAALAALLAAAGCTRSMPSLDRDSGPAPLAPAPSGRVTSNQLPPPPPPPPPMEQSQTAMNGAPGTMPPPGGPNDLNAPGAANAPGGPQGGQGAGGAGGQGAQVASTGGASVTRDSLVGAWKVTSGGGSCQIFMALTKWTGGYRAASRGCPGQVADVSAWDVSGSQVVLKDSGGGTVAQLSPSGGNRYDGQTSGGQQISLYR